MLCPTHEIPDTLPREAAFVEIRNVLASKPFDQVQRDEVTAILARSRLVQRDVVQPLQVIFEHAVLTLAADRELSSADRRALAALQSAFDLTDAEATEATERAVGAVFKKVMREALADGTFTPSERQLLKDTSAALGMSEAQTTALYEAAAVAAVQGAFDVVTADRRYSEVDEQQVHALAASLGVTIRHADETAALLERFRGLARIEAGELPQITVPIHLARGEVCHFAASSVAYKELRTVTKRVNYSGPTASVRLMKGLRWRVGSISVERVTQDVLTPVDTVEAYFTNRKVFLRGARKNTSVPLSKLAHFTVFSDGIQLEKHAGKDIYLIGSADWELAGACLDAALRRL